ncbi:hypothetical protein [Pseudoalteromonas sp. C12FD-1]
MNTKQRCKIKQIPQPAQFVGWVERSETQHAHSVIQALKQR